MDTPRIISVDDHVLEPPDLWPARLPAKFRDRGPRVERDWAVGSLRRRRVLVREGRRRWRAVRMLALRRHGCGRSRSVGRGRVRRAGSSTDLTYEQVRPGLIQTHVSPTWTATTPTCRSAFRTYLGSAARSSWKTVTGARAPLCGGVQRLDDRRVVRGDGKGRLIPLTMVPLWDVELAAAEVRRSRRARQLRGRPSPRIRSRSACRRSTTRTTTGSRSSRRARTPRPPSACTSARARRCRPRRPTRRSS